MKKLLLIVVIASLTTLSGCETFDPYTGEEKTSNTAKGAGIGAGVGAVLAYIANRDESSKKRKKRMLQAAGIGAIAGGGVGYYMDTQEAKLRKTLRATGVSVELQPGSFRTPRRLGRAVPAVAGCRRGTHRNRWFRRGHADRRQQHRGRPQPEPPRRAVAAANHRGLLAIGAGILTQGEPITLSNVCRYL